MRLFCIFLGLGMFVLVSCKKETSNTSDLMHGHLKEDSWKSNTLFSLPPKKFRIGNEIAYGVRISVCDTTAEKKFAKLVIEALDEWLGPFYGYFEVYNNCVKNATIAIDDKQKCSFENAIAETFPVSIKKNKSWTIRICKKEKVNYQVILHEVGHIFGQCDRYNTKSEDGQYHPQMGANCDDSKVGTDGVFNKSSAMQVPGERHPGTVTKDDIQGMVEFVKRADVSTNVPWQVLFDREVKGWRDLNSDLYKVDKTDFGKF